MQAGVPDGAPRPPPRTLPPSDRIRSAIASVALEMDEEPRMREPLRAWLSALAHHWPSSFDELAGEAGRRLARELESAPIDPNRYLKLRRVAIENLAGRL